MTNEELADLITARTANLRDFVERRFDSQEESFDRKLAEQDARSVDRMMILEEHIREHFDLKLSTVQTHIYGKLLSIESDMLDLRSDIAKLRETVNIHARVLDARR